MSQMITRPDPAPSRLKYRMERLMLTPLSPRDREAMLHRVSPLRTGPNSPSCTRPGVGAAGSDTRFTGGVASRGWSATGSG